MIIMSYFRINVVNARIHFDEKRGKESEYET